jgi:dTMP kinase
MFITFEGSEGCGKTTQAAALVEALKRLGRDVLAVREPGGTLIGDQVREILTSLKNTTMLPRTEILLFQASRAQLVEEVLRPHLAAGGWVVCDRYGDSTLAYQGYGYQLDLQTLKNLVDFATAGLKPEITFLLDLEVEEGLRRRAAGGSWNRLDALSQDFYQRVRAGYLEMARSEPERWVTVNAALPAAEIHDQILNHLLAHPAMQP